MEKIMLFIVSLLFCLFFINLVGAFGIVSPYSADRPLTVYSGEVGKAQLQLIVGPDGEEVEVQAEIIDDGGIASFVDIDLEYSISQEEPAVVNIRLDIPKTASVGKEYIVKLRFTDITPSESEQMIALRTGSVVFLKPIVIEKPREEIDYNWIILLIVLIVAVSVIIWFVVKGRKNIKLKKK